MFITVAICTFNRAESLRRTLNSLVAMEVPTDLEWELLIVNNNSTDHTNRVTEDYLDRLPLRREFEPQPGLANARNRAIDVAKGEYIVWTDDDVVVEPGWLTAYVEAFRSWPDAVVFGGRITPRYEPPVVPWVAESEELLGGPFAIRDFGEEVQRLCIAEDRIPYGANFALRAAEQRNFKYDPNLGLAPNRTRYGDEVEVLTRLLGSGATGYWIPEAAVEHCIGRDRQTVHYVAAHYKGWGQTCAYLNEGIAEAPLLFGVPRRIWPRLILWWLLYRLSSPVSPARVWVKYLKAYYYNKGVLEYWRKPQVERYLPDRISSVTGSLQDVDQQRYKPLCE